VDADTAKERLRAERAEIKAMLPDSEAAVDQDRSAENEQGDADDRAQPLTAEGIDDSVAKSLRDRLAALDRAEQRLSDGTYGLSIRSGVPIADARLDADPAAELTIDEARGG
jgi:DnaK suppressor protein